MNPFRRYTKDNSIHRPRKATLVRCETRLTIAFQDGSEETVIVVPPDDVPQEILDRVVASLFGLVWAFRRGGSPLCDGPSLADAICSPVNGPVVASSLDGADFPDDGAESSIEGDYAELGGDEDDSAPLSFFCTSWEPDDYDEPDFDDRDASDWEGDIDDIVDDNLRREQEKENSYLPPEDDEL